MKSNYEIENVMNYFFEICKIPRASGKEEKIADYIENFARIRQLECIRDINNNIIIKKFANNTSQKESIILQGHTDMVCQKEKNYNHNFEKDPIDVYIEENFIKARGTTLGADNGIGVAIILAILDSKDINHPPIEAIFTVQEETTMLGAKTIDVSNLKSNKMICLDSFRENELLIGCANARIFDCEIEGNRVNIDTTYKLAKIELTGFIGGHSGNDIAKRRGNPIEEIGNLLSMLNDKYNIFIKDISGGEKVNVIPREACVEIYIRDFEIENIKKEIKNFEKLLKIRQNKNFDNVKINFELIEKNASDAFDKLTMKKILEILGVIPNGVFFANDENEPLVSLNIGKICCEEKNIKLMFSIRSNRAEKEKELLDLLYEGFEAYNVKVETGFLAGYEHKEKSEFVEKCRKIYIEKFKKQPKMVDMHICLEAGFFGEKIPNLDYVAIAPDIFDAHSPTERCSISSLKRVYNYIIEILEKF